MMPRLILGAFFAGLVLLSSSSLVNAQSRDLHAERIVVDDDANDGTRNTITIQTPGTLPQDVVLTIPDPGTTAAEFLLAPPGSGGPWFLKGNTGTTAGSDFLGTVDNQPFEIHVFETSASAATGTRRVARFEPINTAGSGPNIIFGFSGNGVQSGATGGTVGGGGQDGLVNLVNGNFGTIGGGYGNTAGAGGSIGGGISNTIGVSANSAVGGGTTNTIDSSLQSVIGGGSTNQITSNANNSVIAGGNTNTISASFRSAIGGGFTNAITNGSNNSIIAGGNMNTIDGSFRSTIGGGFDNEITAGANNATIGGGSSNVLNNAPGSVIPGGSNLTLDGASQSFGFLADNGSTPMTISTTNVAVFGNTDLWLANNDNSASQLRLYEANSSTGAFPGSTNYTAFQTQPQSADIEYMLPAAAGPVGSLLAVDAVAGSQVTLDWTSDLTTSSLLVNTGSAVTNSRIVVNEGHWTSQGTAPAAAGDGTNLAGAITVTPASTDVAGILTATDGGGVGTGVITVTFNSAYASTPVVMVVPGNATAGLTSFYVSNVTTTSFDINTATTSGNGTDTYVFNYQVIEID